MFTRKEMLQCQKMREYLDIFDRLIEKSNLEFENYIKEKNFTRKNTHLSLSSTAESILHEVARKALNDKIFEE